MEIRRDALFGTVALLSIMALVAFGTIGLIARMGPAIHHTLEKNGTSMDAAEQMLVLLARSGGAALDPAGRRAYDDALRVLQQNVTEPGERTLIASLRERRADTAAGDAVARLASIGDLDGIIEINRAAISRADERAQQLGVTGAWAVVLMTLVAMFISYVAARRLDRRVIAPVVHLHRVLEQAAEGESHRRCHERGGAREIEDIYEVVNDLLDHRLKTTEVAVDATGTAIRAALVRLLDDRPVPSFVLDAGGELLAANKLGLDDLAAEHGDELRHALRRAARSSTETTVDVASFTLHGEPLEGAPAMLCTLSMRTIASAAAEAGT